MTSPDTNMRVDGRFDTVSSKRNSNFECIVWFDWFKDSGKRHWPFENSFLYGFNTIYFLYFSAVFSPSCLSHTVLTQKDWLKVRIKGYSLSEALECWFKTHHHGLQADSDDSSGGEENKEHSDDVGRYKRVNLRKPSCRKHLIDHCRWPLCNPTCPMPIDSRGEPIKIQETDGDGYPINLNDNELKRVDRKVRKGGRRSYT